ncbi:MULTISPECIES: hypothetical protein [Rhizobium/Agrobacterium group]|uniref:hypothetical protein n=1 Tax=Rhizobium/Agrobacterium group TaxID=227290 RepID=UPI00110F10AD|nr:MULTISPECIES: hypothetical protein [Rhizobium/Agrobacterium group]NWJ23544.1 hypothetical protein [Rhizobium sp. RM]TMV19254.1 hypothetical protein BJG94_14200 [Rhizobium sp. Td3]UXS04040.1 hypothetical protein FY156_21265 [Agrobacterium tumefaciens]
MEMTQTRRLAEEYLRLGGTRQVMIDDDKTFVRQYQDDPPAAKAFWLENIAGLDEDTLEDVEFFLPSVNSDAKPQSDKH